MVKEYKQEYPKNYSDASSYAKISDDNINKMVNNALSILSKGESNTVTVSTGNTVVLVCKIHEEDGGGIHVVVSENYKELYIDNLVLN